MDFRRGVFLYGTERSTRMIGRTPEEIRKALARGTARALSAGKRKIMRSGITDRLLGAKPGQVEDRVRHDAPVAAEPVTPIGITGEEQRTPRDAERPATRIPGNGRAGDQEELQGSTGVDTKSQESAGEATGPSGSAARPNVTSSPTTSQDLTPKDPDPLAEGGDSPLVPAQSNAGDETAVESGSENTPPPESPHNLSNYAAGEAAQNFLAPDVPDPADASEERDASQNEGPTEHRSHPALEDRGETRATVEEPDPREGYYYTPKQTADILGTDLFEVNRLVRRGVLPAQSIDRHRWVPAKAFEEFVRREYGADRLANAPEPRKAQGQDKGGSEGLKPIKTLGDNDPTTEPDASKGARTLRREEKSSLRSEARGGKAETITPRTSAYYTGEEAAEKLGVSEDDVRYMSFTGKLKEEVVDGERLFSRRAVEALLPGHDLGVGARHKEGSRVVAEHRSAALEEAADLGAGQGSKESDRRSQPTSASATADDYYTPSQAADLLGKSSAGIFKMIDRGELPALRLDVGRYKWVPANVVIPADAVTSLLIGGTSAYRKKPVRAGLRPYRLTGAGEARDRKGAAVGPSTSHERKETAKLRYGDAPSREATAAHGAGQNDAPSEPSETAATGLPASEKAPTSSKAGRETFAARTREGGAPEWLPDEEAPSATPVARSDVPPRRAENLDTLSKRTRNCLLRAGIASVSDLQKCRRDDLLALRNFGVKCLHEVEEFLAQRSASLRPNRRRPERQRVPHNGGGARSAGMGPAFAHSSLDLPIRDSFAYLHLSRRTQNCLALAGIDSLKDLRAKTAEDLLALQGFGVGCLREVEVFLEAHGSRLGGTGGVVLEAGPVPPPAGFERPEDLEGLLSLLCVSPSLERRLEGLVAPRIDLFLDAITRCQDKASEQIRQGTLDDRAMLEWSFLEGLAGAMGPPARTLSDLLFRLQYLACAGAATPYEDIAALERALDVPTVGAEIAQLTDRLSARELHVLRARFCLVPKTLADLSEEFGVTKQSVRNWEAGIVAKLRQGYGGLPLPRIRAALSQARVCSASSPEGVGRVLRDAGLMHDDFALENLLVVWRAVLPEADPFLEDLVSCATTGLTRQQRSISGQITRVARRELRVNGAVALREIAGVDHAQYSERDAASVLKVAGLQEIVPGYWSDVGKSYALHRVAEKMVKACGPLRAEHVHIGLLRHQQRQGNTVSCPPHVLRAVLEHHGAFYVDGEGTVHLHDLTRGTLPNPAEYAWLEAVASHGPVVHATTMYRALDKNGVNNGLMNYLTKYSEVVQPLGEGLYCLPGSRFAQADIEAGYGQASKRWVARYGAPSREVVWP